MQDLKQLLRMIDPEIHAKLRRAVETGRWEDGTRLRPDQIEHSLQALIAWEHDNLPPEQRIGHMEDACTSKMAAQDTPKPDSGNFIQSLHLSGDPNTRH